MAMITELNCNIREAVHVKYLDGNLFSQDVYGNAIRVIVMDGDEPATLAGTVSGTAIREDGSTVALTDSRIDENVATVVLPAAAYAVPGVLAITIKISDTNTVTTLAYVVANVYRTSTDTVVDPGTIIPSITSLIEQIAEAVASIPADYSSLWAALAETFNASKSGGYAVGEYVTYDGGLYRFKNAHTGSWSSSDVDAVNLGSGIAKNASDISELKSAILQYKDVLSDNNILEWSRGRVKTSDGVADTMYATSRIKTEKAKYGDYSIVIDSSVVGYVYFYSTSYLGYQQITSCPFRLTDYYSSSATDFRIMLTKNPESTIGDGTGTDYSEVLDHFNILQDTRLNTIIGTTEDLTEAKTQTNDKLSYLIDDCPNYNFSLVQGAWNSDGKIETLSTYVATKYRIEMGAGDIIYVSVPDDSGIVCRFTTWNKDGSYIGNIGSWVSSLKYRFSDKLITVMFKKSDGTSLSVSDVNATVTVKSKYTNNIRYIGKLQEYGFLKIPMDEYIQGYWNTSGQSIASSDTFVTTPQIIPEHVPQEYLIPVSDDYDIAYYTWDYSAGTYSNFVNSGWLSVDTRVTVPVGKAVALLIRASDQSDIDADLISYVYYRINKATMVEQWTPKKVACIGDSLTQGVDVGTHVIKENYPYFMGMMLDCTVMNCGVAGADTKEYWHDNMDDFTFDSSIDTVLIMLGTNGGGIPNTLETDVYPFTDYNDYADTYCGCYCKIIRKVIELTQNRAQVILMTPPYTTYSTAQLNRVKQARETILEIGLYYNIPVIDVFAECGMGAYNASVFRPHDGCHFNAKGYHRLGTFVGSKVKALHSEWNLTDVYDDETPVT